MKLRKKQIMIIMFSAFLFVALVGMLDVSARDIDPGDGGGSTTSDNVIENGDFEDNVDGLQRVQEKKLDTGEIMLAIIQ